MRKPRAIDTDRLILNKRVADWISEHTEEHGDCRIFRPEPGWSHIRVAGRDGETHGVSVRRVAFALAHPETHVSADEDVCVTCGHVGNERTGEGCCLNPDHLIKIDFRERRAA